MDPLGIDKAVAELGPEETAIIAALATMLNSVLDRLDGATVTITLAKKPHPGT
jgi:hypothetical protein